LQTRGLNPGRWSHDCRRGREEKGGQVAGETPRARRRPFSWNDGFGVGVLEDSRDHRGANRKGRMRQNAFTEETCGLERARVWSLRAEDCPELGLHRILHLGFLEARAPFRVVRLRPEGSFVMGILHGEGRLMLEGSWRRVKSGALVMAPPRVLNAFEVTGAKPWSFVYVRYAEPAHVRSVVGGTSPARGPGGCFPLVRCLEGLREEWESCRDAKMLHHWVTLTQHTVLRAARPTPGDDRLARLWVRVGESLEQPWTLDLLAREMHCGIELLRKRCQREMGRSPMQQVALLRIEKAKALLESSNATMDSLAERLGFSDGLVFSRAFKRWVGLSPSEYRTPR
jgi:AraC-like DNA-binding protein